MKNNKAITLIALVITIIILLILAGISIALVSGGNGILDKATNAVDETLSGQIREEVQISLIETESEYYKRKYVDKDINVSYGKFVKNLLEGNGIKTSSGAILKLTNEGNVIYIPVESKIPTAEGTFDEETGKIEILGITSSGITLGLNEYFINYNLNDGILNESNPNTYKVDSEDIVLKNPEKEGYIFEGWTGSNGETASTNVIIPSGSSGNKEYIANWVPITYTVSFDGNGATSGELSNESFNYGIEKKLPINVFVKDGCKFKEWNTQHDGTGTSFSDGQNIQNLTNINGKTIILYAQWESDEPVITVTATSNGSYYFVNSDNKWISNNGGVHSSSAITTWNINVNCDVYYDIKYRISSESNYDKFTLVVDGVTICNAISGDGSEISYNTIFLQGNHTVSATYSKDGSGNSNSDNGYVILPLTGIRMNSENSTYLYNTGNECNDLTGGWIAESWHGISSSGGVFQKNTDSIYVKGYTTGSCGEYGAGINKTIDLTNYNKLYVHVIKSTASSYRSSYNYNDYIIGIAKTKPLAKNDPIIIGGQFDSNNCIIEYNVSSLSGSYYIGIYGYAGNGSVTFDKVWLKK